MSNLFGKKILLAITGSIAAYKAAELVRCLRSRGCDVKVVLTGDAQEFITELTLQALSGQPVHTKLLDPQCEASMSHITLAKWCDLLLVAPATANIMAKFAMGIADDLLSTIYLACSAPVAVVPAMNQHMWQHAATSRNYQILQGQGVMVWGPTIGEQACGDNGPGRMIEPNEIIAHLEEFFAPKILRGKKIVITAGPTREPIDPVRFISNYSSGKMGYALAKTSQLLGAETILITGPTALTIPAGVKAIRVETAEEMYHAVMNNLTGCDIFISAAAVADYRPSEKSPHKIKKTSIPQLLLSENIDILLAVSQLPLRPFLVGFAAESENLIKNAKQKLSKKNLDLIVANNVGGKSSPFDSDYNAVSLITTEKTIEIPMTTKLTLANKIINFICNEYSKNFCHKKMSNESINDILLEENR